MIRSLLHTRTVFLITLIALYAQLTACAQPAPTVPTANPPAATVAPSPLPPPTQAPTAPANDQPSFLSFEHVSGDAGNFFLLAGQTITFTWQNAPAGADRYEFALAPLDKQPTVVVGVDKDPADGVTIAWSIPEKLAGELRGIAYFADGRTVKSDAATVYSGEFPPAGVCSLLARHQPVEIYRQPDRSAEKFAQLRPGVYARVLEVAPDEWYRIDAGAALGADNTPASGDGWVNSDKGVLLAGACPP